MKYTLELLKEKAREIYGDFFIFDKTLVKNVKDKLIITCPIHGDFEINIDNFINGKQGCKYCNREKSFKENNLEVFKRKVKEIYDGKFDVNKIVFKGIKEYVTVICPKHGEFKVSAESFIYGKCGCPKCKKEEERKKVIDKYEEIINEKYKGLYKLKRETYISISEPMTFVCQKHGEFQRTLYALAHNHICQTCLKEKHDKELTEKVLRKIKEVHGDKYDLSKIGVIGKFDDEITIICKKHDEFKMRIPYFLNGHDCPKCSSENRTLNNDDFIKRVSNIHNNKYIYCKTDVNHRTDDGKVCVTCPIHGDFWVTPNNHSNGKGCPKCAGKSKTTESVIKEFKELHGDTLIFDEIEYKSAKTKVKVICPEHGGFWITPNKLLQGQGCPKCKQSHLEREISLLLQKYNINYESEKRFDWLVTNNGRMSLDFYLPEYNIAIECQGQQHFNGDNRFKFKLSEESLQRDILKYHECKENNIKLIYYTTNNIFSDDYYDNDNFGNIYQNDNVILGKKQMKKYLSKLTDYLPK